MKTAIKWLSLLLATGVLTGPPLSTWAGNKSYEIRQQHLDANTPAPPSIWFDAETGEARTRDPIMGTGSIFELFAANGTVIDQELILNSALFPVGPQVEFQIIPEDRVVVVETKAGQKISRADMEYGYRITVTDPVYTAEAPRFVWEGVDQLGLNYDPATYTPGETNEIYSIASYEIGNTIEVIGGGLESPDSQDPTQAMGVETFAVTLSLPDVIVGLNNQGHGNNIDGVDVSNPGQGGGGGVAGAEDTDPEVDDEKKPAGNAGGKGKGKGGVDIGISTSFNVSVVVWPVGDATINGFPEDAAGNLLPIRGLCPILTVNYIESFPISETYVRVVAGPRTDTPLPADDSSAAEIHGTRRIHDTEVPQNDTVFIAHNKIAPLLGADGVYTIEVITKTPFYEVERLADLTFNLQRDVDFRGNISTVNE